VNGFWTWVLANLKLFFRDRGTLFWSIVFPIFFMGLLGLGFGRTDPIDFRIGIVDEDGTPWSDQLRGVMGNESLPFAITNYTTLDPATAAVEGDDLDLVLVIPRGFSDFMNLSVSGVNATLQLPVYWGVSDRGAGSVAVGFVQDVLDGFYRAVTQNPPRVSVDPTALNARSLEYIDFLAPGILAMSVMQNGVFGLSLFIVSAREKRILKRFQATPAGAAYILAGRIIPALLISLVQVGLLLSVAILAFGVSIVGNFGILLIAVMFGAIVFICLGFLISSIAKTAENAEQLTNVATLPMFFLGGVFIPVDRLPEAVQAISYAMPLTYFSDSLRAIMLHDAGLAEVAVSLGVMGAFAAVVFLLAVKLFKWE